ncbi:MAG TPA: outer membrane protein [Xanthobacteraceae bacterium]|nr:outer membrane protein [Xanthobacteraceae bacterium]
MGRFCRAGLTSFLAGPSLTALAALGFLAFGLATAASVAPARAADIAVPGPSYYPKSIPPPAIYDWTGIYVGGHVGGGILTDSVSQTATSPTGFNLTNSGSLRPAGVLGGAQIGANYEFAPWVVGVEGSWTDSTISGSTLIPCGCAIGAVSVPQERFTSHALWFAALTGRVGYAANDWLFYAKAGGAWLHVSYTEDLIAIGGPTAGSQVLSDNRTGFTAGAGIEFGLVENLSGKIEYDFYGFGTKNYNFAITPVSVRSNLHALIVGLNYRFNWSGGPKP